jgi:hypothetical protein
MSVLSNEEQSAQAARLLAETVAEHLNKVAPRYAVLADALEKEQKDAPPTTELGEDLLEQIKDLGDDGFTGLKIARQVEQLKDHLKTVVPPHNNPYFVWPMLRHMSESSLVLLQAETLGDVKASAILQSSAAKQWMKDRRVREWMKANIHGRKIIYLFQLQASPKKYPPEMGDKRIGG